ncbi:MAG: hypothetical protein FH749_01190 [Firmicutes bacterium]|nr:hypothetical protein [Bacillota bacterium]
MRKHMRWLWFLFPLVPLIICWILELHLEPGNWLDKSFFWWNSNAMFTGPLFLALWFYVGTQMARVMGGRILFALGNVLVLINAGIFFYGSLIIATPRELIYHITLTLPVLRFAALVIPFGGNGAVFSAYLLILAALNGGLFWGLSRRHGDGSSASFTS